MTDVPALLTTELSVVLRLCVGGVLLIAGVSKVRAASRSGLVAIAAELRPRLFRRLVLLVPPGEIALGVLLLTGAFVPQALMVALSCFVGFTAVLRSLVRRGYRGSCACFGRSTDGRVNQYHVARTGVLALMTGIALAGHLTNPQSHRAHEASVEVWATAAILLFAGALVELLVSAANRWLAGVESTAA